MGEHFGVARALFVFFGSLPYAFFRIGYFIFTLPRRLRGVRKYRLLPKLIVYERLSNEQMSVHEMVECIHRLRVRHGQEDFPANRSMWNILEALWDEEMSPHWKVPTVAEALHVRMDMLANLRIACPRTQDFLIWAIAEDSHMFVALDLLSGKYTHAEPRPSLSVLRGRAPDSKSQCFAYAVSVTIRDDAILR